MHLFIDFIGEGGLIAKGADFADFGKAKVLRCGMLKHGAIVQHTTNGRPGITYTRTRNKHTGSTAQ